MMTPIRTAAWLSVLTNALVWVLIVVEASGGGLLGKLLRLAVTPGWVVTSGLSDPIFGVLVMFAVNWLVWVAVWWLVLGTIREFRGCPAW
jgi:hypothetical protein